MFQFGRFAHYATSLQLARFPHSDMYGSPDICSSPYLFAAYHVLHRLWEPRHPPCALSYFLLRMPLLLGMECFLIVDLNFSLGYKYPMLQNKTTSLLLSSLSIIFFNMSKNVIEYITKCSKCYLLTNCFSQIVENNGFEPLTPCVQGRCSSQLS